MGGSKSRGERVQETGVESNELSQEILKQQYEQTSPVRSYYLSEWDKLMGGEPSTYMNTAFSALRGPIEAQYGTAKENVLANTPQGGGLFDQLTNVETARAGGLSNMLGQLYMDEMNKAYGTAWGVPTTTVAGLQNLGQQAVSAGNAAGQTAGGIGSSAMSCCFNFLEAEGEIYWTVRRYRDEHYNNESPIGRGYIETAKILVPLMRRSKEIKRWVRILMTRPLRAYASWYYGENRSGFIFWPFKVFWTGFWGYLGR